MVAVLPGQSTLEASCSSAKFEPELFAFAAAESFETVTNYNEYTSEDVKATTADTIVLTAEPAEDDEYIKKADGTVSATKRSSVSITGFTQIPDDGTLAAGTYKVDKATKTITFYTGEVPVGTSVRVDYKVAVTSIDEMKTNNQNTAICEAFAKFPVYSDGTDCTQAGVIGYVYLTIYRARVSAQPTLGGSYKAASTFDFTISAIDAKRADGNVYSIAYKKI